MVIQAYKTSCPEQSHTALRSRQQRHPGLFIWTSKVSRLSQPKLIPPCKELGPIAASIWKNDLKVLGKCIMVTPKGVNLSKEISLIIILSSYTSQHFLQQHKTTLLRRASSQVGAPVASDKVSKSSRKSLVRESLVLKFSVRCPSLTTCILSSLVRSKELRYGVIALSVSSIPARLTQLTTNT